MAAHVVQVDAGAVGEADDVLAQLDAALYVNLETVGHPTVERLRFAF